ncbi:hydroxyacid dehydrogenase [Candidatus Woesearchaeota archaeon]|nr:hydroxyacid dehydrogenase [Candidatus Woesearchaeota archaeon]
MKVVIADSIHPSGAEELRSAGFSVAEPVPERVAVELRDAAALIVRSRTKVTKELLSGAPKLRCVVRAGAGMDNIDVTACKDRGIAALNVPDVNSVSVAEHAMALLLALARRVPQAHASLSSRWDKSSFMGIELSGKTLGIVGFGRIGREVAARARAFGMRILAYDPYVSTALAHEHHATMVGLDELLRGSDVVTLHCLLSPETRHLISAERLALMRPSALLVNCSRGAVVDEQALYAALQSHGIAGAALDVFEVEGADAVGNRLFSLDNVVATPHIAGQTAEAQERIARIAAQLVREALLKSTFN